MACASEIVIMNPDESEANSDDRLADNIDLQPNAAIRSPSEVR